MTNSVSTSTPIAYILVGVPGVGKTTWVESQTLLSTYVYLSTDRYVEQFAQEDNKPYNVVFKLRMPEAVKCMVDDAIIARNNQQDIIWDQTSTNRESRTRKIDMLQGYRKIAVVFRTPEREELDRRLASRPNKIIPSYVVDGMIENFEEPTLDEGFDEIIYV